MYMKRILLITVAMLLCIASKADKFNVTTPGTLEQLVNNADNDSITELTVTGTINWKDLKFIRSCDGKVKALQIVDLTDVDIEESEDSCYAQIMYTDKTYFSYTYLEGVRFYYSNTPRQTLYNNFDWSDRTSHYMDLCYNNDLGGLFFGMKTLRKAYLPKKTTKVGACCFAECTSLQNVNNSTTALSNEIDSIGQYAFDGCKSLTGTLDLTNVKYINDNAFSHNGFSKVVLSHYSEKIVGL